MSKNKKTRLRNKINKTEQSNLKKLKEIGKKLKPRVKSAADKVSKSIKKNAPKVKSNIKKTTKNISKSVKKNAPNLKKQGLKIGKGILKKGKGVGNVAKGIAKGTVKGVGGLAVKAATAKAMYESAKTGVKSWGMKGKDGKRAGLARIPGLIGKAWKNRGKLNIKKLNPASDENKRIREKKASMTKDNAGKVKSQISAIKRKRDGVKLSDVRANQEKKMRDAARKRNEQFKKTGKSTYEQRKADAKKRMQDAARKRNEAFQKKRAKK